MERRKCNEKEKCESYTLLTLLAVYDYGCNEMLCELHDQLIRIAAAWYLPQVNVMWLFLKKG